MKILLPYQHRHYHPVWSWSVLLLLGQHVSKAADEELTLNNATRMNIRNQQQHQQKHPNLNPIVYTSNATHTLASTSTSTDDDHVPLLFDDPLLFHDIPPHHEVIPNEGPLAGYDLAAAIEEEEDQLLMMMSQNQYHQNQYPYPDRHLRSQTDGSPLNPPPEAGMTHTGVGVDGDVSDKDEDEDEDKYGGEDGNMSIMPYYPPTSTTTPEYEETLVTSSPSHTASYGNFLPLECNVHIENAPCDKLSNHLRVPTNDNDNDNNEPLVIPCGVCYQYDLGEGHTSFPNGIRVIGKLHFPETTSNAIITTPYVIVEGVLSILNNNDKVGGMNDESVTFVMSGVEDVQFSPSSSSSNIKSCPAETKHVCNLGPKPFVIAGGKLDIRAFEFDGGTGSGSANSGDTYTTMDTMNMKVDRNRKKDKDKDTDTNMDTKTNTNIASSCTTHSPILDKVYADIKPNVDKFESFTSFLPSCRTNASETDFFRYNFDEGYGNWTGNFGSFMNIVDNSLKVTNRKFSEDGPQYDFTSLDPAACLAPGQKYLLSLRIKLDKADGTLDGEPTTCKKTSNHEYCPHVRAYMRTVDRHSKDSTLARMYNFRSPNYGEWFDWTTTFTLNEDQLDSANIAYSFLRIYHADPGVDMSLDYFRISLPSKVTYSDPLDLCGELILNGDAEADEIHPYPIEPAGWNENVFVLRDDDGNNFFRLPDRSRSSSTIQSQLNVECLQQGASYLASANMRIHSEFDEEYYFYLRYKKPDGSWHSHTYLQCPPQRYSDGWVKCSGEFIVTDVIASAIEAKWHFHFSSPREVTATVDFDDISIKYNRGPVGGLIVNEDDAHCWGTGADIHIGSSTYYSWRREVPNSFNTMVRDVTNNNDGTLSIGLIDAPYIPVISLSEHADFAADVALLSRNVKIRNDEDEVGGKGAYLQILKTPGVAQVIRGVEFISMGRKREEDRHPLQLLYSGSIEGTDISSNSIYGSNSRCIVIEGTSNVTVSDNVAALNRGHCVYVGYESLDNVIKHNLVSDTLATDWSDRLPLENDYHPSAFRNRYGRNSYISNKAIASRTYGFSFDNNYWTYYENHSYGQPRPRLIQMGVFSFNEAKSNGDSGMMFWHFEQKENIVLSNLKSIKNKYYSFFMYNGARVSVENSLFAESAFNIEMRWCDDVNINNVDIRGISPFTKHIVDSPYYNKPCISSGFHSPIGYRMHTTIHRWGDLNKGAKLSNVEFTFFDHDDQCSTSIPIGFNTNDKRDGHWDYLSSFTNVRVNGERLIDANSANEKGVPDIVIADPDGSSDPSRQASGASVFVSSKPYLTDFARGNCEQYHDGIAYCRNACYRTVQLIVGQTSSANYDLRVTRNDGIVTYAPGFYQYDGSKYYNRSLYEGYPRKYAVSLPHGTYQLEFFENGESVWPQYVYEVWEGIPDCEGYVSISNITVVEPALGDGECDDLITNGDMERGLEGWTHRDWNSGNKGAGYLKAVPGAGISGSLAIGYFGRTWRYAGIGQNLDTRCFHQNLGALYEVKAWFRLENGGIPFICNRFEGSYPNRCPKGTLKNVRYVDPKTKKLDWDYDQDKAQVAMPNDSNNFNLLHGVIKVDEKYQSIHRAWIYFEHYDQSLDMILDNYSITKLEAACSGNFVRNGDFAIGDSRFWYNWGNARWDIVDVPGVSLGTKALKIFGRGHADHGIYQDLYVDVDCISENDRIKIFARYQVQDPQGNPIQCDRTRDNTLDECAFMRAKFYSDNNGHPHPFVASTTAVHEDVENGDWAWMSGIYTLGTAEADHTRMYLNIGGPHMDNSIVLDYVTIEPLSKTCDQLIYNPSFQDGSSSYWRVSNRAADISIQSPRANDQYSLLLQHHEVWHVLEQDLDTRCLVEGQDFVLLAKMKLVDVNDHSLSLGCNTNERNVWTEDHCPIVRLRGRGCDSGDFHLILWNENQAAWNPDEFNLFSHDIPIDENMGSCDRITVELGYFLPKTRAILIDDVKFEHKSTFAPTKAPTFAPTKVQTIGPTLRPTIGTDSPTATLVLPCPPVDQVANLDAGSVILSLAEANSLCTVTKVVSRSDLGGGTTQTIIPLVRSYDMNKWELSSGSVALSTFDEKDFYCYDQGCQINLPALNKGEKYQLTSSDYSLSPRDEYARFLETASFGTRATDLDLLESVTGEGGPMRVISDYVASQMDTTEVPMTSHREFWRARSNPRASWSTKMGTPGHPCDEMSRWRKFSFVRNDVLWWAPRNLRVVGAGDGNIGPYTLYLDGNVRTVVDDFWLNKNGTYSFDPDFEYHLCSIRGESSGGELWIRLEDGICVQAENPRVDITGLENEMTYVLDLSNVDDQLIPIDEDFTNGEEFLLPITLEDGLCNSIPSVQDRGDEQIYGRLSDDSWLLFDPRLDLEQNTPDAPLADGGKVKELASGGSTLCANVPRTFLNEDECVLSSNACKPSANTEVEVLLEGDTIRNLYHLTGRYVYGLKGLHVVDQYDDGKDFAWKLPHPCTDSLRSRWLRKNLTDCNPSDIYSGTNASLVELISAETDSNPYIRDIFFSSETHFCNDTDTDPDIEITFGDQCWKRVHSDFLSIYDLTYWVKRHPGGAYHIQKWAENDDAFLMFPNGHPINDHPMHRWHNNYHKFTYVGRYGDVMRIRDLPNDLRTEDVMDYYQDKANIDTSGVLVCGSPNEVPNNKTLGFTFDVANDFQTGYWNVDENKKNTWLMINIHAPDQLRQRVAWAFAQILVIVKDAIGRGRGQTEWFVQYYDIFVRNAFGNYRDILKEISFSPLMAENLSFLYSRSSAYVWQHYTQKAQADENFAREIMQLFSIGLIQLNLDGSPKLDENGNTILAYTNDDIMSLSRAWTGFNLQLRRGNVEGWDNRLDPMRLESSWRDLFPKSDVSGGYIGDYYPLCEDLPRKAFLQQGATYRFLGSSSLPELMSDPVEFESDETTRLVLDPSSLLKEELCNQGDSNECQYQNTVVLSESKACQGVECAVDEIRVVQVASNAFYEYVREPCVAQAFYNDAKKISPYYRTSRSGVMCGNPALPEASEACCSFGSTTATRNSNYDGERMPFGTAVDRCKANSKNICDFNHVSGDYQKVAHTYYWTSDDCQIRLKIKSDGMVTIVHQTFDSPNQVPHLRDGNENWFKVFWEEGNYPKATNECDGLCKVVDGDSCLCGTSVSKSRGFGTMPGSIDVLLEKLFIGFPDPNIINTDSYVSSYDPKTGITTHLKDGSFDSSTVFEFSDVKGRTFFVKNSIENVQVRSLENEYTGYSLGYSFRNAPQFMSFVPNESTVRDAQFETEATLDHYFYHDNTAPFLASRLIQRLVISNPSPRYIKVVATAFTTGLYAKEGKTFGSGKYGDLAATFAAIYLDREARTIALDADPSYGALREPLLKVMSVMRSMNFSSTYPITRLSNMKVDIGQMVHEFDSVFSFFLPEFEPYGRVGDASLVSPEATLLDMPRIVGTLNGLTSLTRYGLSSCYGGFGAEYCRESMYLPSRYGVLEHNRTSSDSGFSFETFEGESLTGGFDNIWNGRAYRRHRGSATKDPTNPSNHVFRPAYQSYGEFFSQPVKQSGNIVVKFQYFGTEDLAGGCIGYSSVEELYWEKWVFCDAQSWYAENIMDSNNEWIDCQFEVPLNEFRIVLGDRRSNGDAYFDNIQVGSGSGTFCGSEVFIEEKTPPGQLGRSGAVVDELATLLTAGRLSATSRLLIRDAYDRAGSGNDGLRIAQEMILTSAEFHATNPVNPEDQSRTVYSFPTSTGKPYKALIYVMFSGGCDSFNMLAPHTCSANNDLYQGYLDIREQVAIAKSDLLPINATNQNCTKYGLHPDLPAIQKMYNDGDLLFFANTGVMTEPVDKTNYWILTNTQLFAHNHQQQETKRVDPYDSSSGTGVIGRMADVLNGIGHNVGLFSVDRFSVALVGTPGVSETPMIVNRNGVPSVYLDEELGSVVASLHNATPPDSGFFGETWSDELMKSLGTNELLSAELEGIETNMTFPTSYLSLQLETVSKLIATREARGVDTDTFYVEIGGYDTHSDVEEHLSNRFVEVNEGFEAFAGEMKNMGLWSNVTVIQTSDFARTLNPNSGDGTDHAWGGNYMMMGGSVKGKQIAGNYPDSFADDGPLNIGRGRLIPTTPWDAVFKGIATWMGVPDDDLDTICPNLGNFDATYFFNPHDLFEGLVGSSPSIYSDQSSEPSSKPTETPSVTTEEPSSVPTISPSDTPTVPFDCSDDSSYTFMGDTLKTCEWVGSSLERCAEKDTDTGMYIFEHCRKTCGKCSCENENFYYLKEKRTCKWVEKQPDVRCDMDMSPDIRENCKGACGESCCRDNPRFKYNGEKRKRCKWVGKQKAQRCGLSQVAMNCPATCSSQIKTGGCP